MDLTMETASIGIIGMGEMGKMYARRLSDAGWRINACDKPENYDPLRLEFASQRRVEILPNGHLVSRISDYIIYSVEAAAIEKIVAQYGPSTKVGAIVGGQTSCKAPELAAFDKYLPPDVEIISCHSLHGPNINPRGQPLVLIQHRASDKNLKFVEQVFSSFESKYVYISGEMHDPSQPIHRLSPMQRSSVWVLLGRLITSFPGNIHGGWED
jgi:prephenate dehydrogenase (NADP+)